ncbi:MAG TPA: hydrogenase expression/formation protein HypE [Gemmatimonadaceae bacterium]|nr:hydrogenase expression/formation protein HypE [Gemmatimonadaceae bacterium]
MTAPVIGMKHGAGGSAMRRLIAQTLTRGFVDAPLATPQSVGLAAFDDGAAIQIAADQWLVLTTDSHVVQPIEFPGGDIGRLAIAGTVNDLAMMGATEPLGLTCGVIIEEGFPLGALERVQCSMQAACVEAGVTVVTGDTKVMRKGEIDGLVINTAGAAITRRVVRDSGLAAGDAIIVTGSSADHGMALMAARNGFAIEGDLASDVAPINGLVRAALAAAPDAIVAMKDPTRGGLAGSLHEMAAKARVGILIHEDSLPVRPAARALADMLGIDPMHVANEGKAVLGVRGGRAAAARVLDALRAHPLGRDAAIVGEALGEHAGRVILDTGIGRRLVAEPEGEPLPRIC